MYLEAMATACGVWKIWTGKPGGHIESRGMIQQIGGSATDGLPDAIEIRFTVGRAWQWLVGMLAFGPATQ